MITLQNYIHVNNSSINMCEQNNKFKCKCCGNSNITLSYYFYRYIIDDYLKCCVKNMSKRYFLNYQKQKIATK